MKRIVNISLSVMIVIVLLVSSTASFFAAEIDIAEIGAEELIPPELEIIDDTGDSIAMSGISIEGSDLQASSAASLPSRYSLKDLGYTSDLKNQYNSGTCWAYSATSILESYLLKNDLYKNQYSPLDMAYMQSINDNGTGWATRTNWLRDGGNIATSSGYFMSFGGCRDYGYLEDLSLININQTITDTLANQKKSIAKEFNEAHSPSVTADEIVYIDASNRDNIKSAIYEHSAVGASFTIDWAYFDTNKINYYAPSINYSSTSYGGGHAIAIVGWDDNYPRTNFKSNYRPQNNGAWICQNSWGANSCDSGFFYISYEDSTLFDEGYGAPWAVVGTHEIGKYEHLNSLVQNLGALNTYDPYGNYPSYESVFLSKVSFEENDLIESVYFFSDSVGATYNVYLVPATSTGEPSAVSKWTTLKSGTITYAGYLKVDLNNYLVDPGDYFITVGLKSYNGSGSKMGYVLEDQYFGDGSICYILDGGVKSKTSYYGYKLGSSFGKTDTSTTQTPLAFYINTLTTKNYKCGDANFDKQITVSDATYIQRILARLQEDISEENKICADVDNDGSFTIRDATFIQRYLARFNDKLPIGELIK